jgi:hypothetical protein
VNKDCIPDYSIPESLAGHCAAGSAAGLIQEPAGDRLAR